ncbi:MAG TPA: hypothetical protein VHR66_28100 [Gemmataceae bacterium]|jgi:hypothetical protein|nr:hypothetical protein [Gemmataceae bacterium]
MEKNGSVLAMNQRLARKVRREGKANPKSPYANRFVGIANGKVVIIADTLREMAQRLRKIEPDASKCYAVDVAADYDRVYEV